VRALTFDVVIVLRCQTVNLMAYAFEGSNPSAPILKPPPKQNQFVPPSLVFIKSYARFNFPLPGQTKQLTNWLFTPQRVVRISPDGISLGALVAALRSHPEVSA